MSMIAFREDWKPLSARIESYKSLIDLLFRSHGFNQKDPEGPRRVVVDILISLINDLNSLNNKHKEYLPKTISNQFQSIDRWKSVFLNNENMWKSDQLITTSLRVIGLRDEIEFFLANSEDRIISLTERAFSHLQRLIYIDEEYRQKWNAAFASGEASLEKLGAVHLLWHGIYAFKIHARERTDLVFPRPPNESDAQGASGIVLTEWKKASSPNEAKNKALQAIAQCKAYQAGSLSSLELHNTRYVVVVTQEQVQLSDVVEDSITYRHINIATDPQSPSQVAKSLPVIPS